MTDNGKAKNGWKQDPAGVQRDILAAATQAFARSGLAGTRIEEIAALTRTSKRMIYYYFGDKDALYTRVLEAAYAKVRQGEAALDLAGLPPELALTRLVTFTFDHHRANPDFIRLVMIENTNHADFLARSDVIRRVNTAAIDRLANIIARGQAAGVFRAGLDPVALHWKISALSFFNVSNRPTFSALFGPALYGPDAQTALRDQVAEMVLSSVKETPR